ncbi:annexin A7-like [Drosophila suzukii]|uniref:Annexin A7-like n=1 Tax=Drosophila suzukii TaxID=28584 RepID=A0ABM4TYV4_DROSZ
MEESPEWQAQLRMAEEEEQQLWENPGYPPTPRYAPEPCIPPQEVGDDWASSPPRWLPEIPPTTRYEGSPQWTPARPPTPRFEQPPQRKQLEREQPPPQQQPPQRQQLEREQPPPQQQLEREQPPPQQ